jgi:outer membrane protein TolC
MCSLALLVVDNEGRTAEEPPGSFPPAVSTSPRPSKKVVPIILRTQSSQPEVLPQPQRTTGSDQGIPSLSGCAPTSKPLFQPDEIFAPGTELMLIDLPTALKVANNSNPTIAFARLRVDEAYGRVRQADLMWIPNLDMEAAYLRHDGNIQNSRGQIFNIDKSSFTIFGGPSIWVGTSDALFAPLIARRLAAAQEAASQATTNDIQLNVALAYLDLLQAYGQYAVNADILARDREVLRRAEVADRTQLAKTGADLPRIQTEYQLRLQERLLVKGQIRVASSRLARLLLLEPSVGLVPADPTVVPISFIPEDGPVGELVEQAVANRPELAETRALISASEARLRQARLDPLLPHLTVNYYGGTFGGGVDSFMGDFRARGDATAAAVWELKNFGFGNIAESRVRRTQVGQATAHAMEVQAQVADEVNQAVQIARLRREALASAQESIRQATEMFRRLDVIAFGMLGPNKKLESLEPLLAIQALAQARTQYLGAVIDYNRAQFQLVTAVGIPPMHGATTPVEVPIAIPPAPPTYVPPKQ